MPNPEGVPGPPPYPTPCNRSGERVSGKLHRYTQADWQPPAMTTREAQWCAKRPWHQLVVE